MGTMKRVRSFFSFPHFGWNEEEGVPVPMHDGDGNFALHPSRAF